MRIAVIVNHEWTSETVTVLRAVVGVVPKCTGLFGDVKVVLKRMSRNDWALRHESGTYEDTVRQNQQSPREVGVLPSAHVVFSW